METDRAEIRRLWWWRTAYVHVGEDRVDNGYNHYPRYSKIQRYERKKFKPGQRVRVTKVRMRDYGGFENLFLPFAIMNLYGERTKEVEVFELLAPQ